MAQNGTKFQKQSKKYITEGLIEDSTRCKQHYHWSKATFLVCHTESWHRAVCNQLAESQQVDMQHFHYNSCKISRNLQTSKSTAKAKKKFHLLLS